MAKPTKKQETPNLPKTPEQAVDELTELSQEFGLYGLEDNPLVKATSTDPLQAPVEAVESVQGEINTSVAQTDEIASITTTEPPKLLSFPVGIHISDPKDDKQTVRNGWGDPLPTKVVTITKSYLRETVAELLYIASLGGELDTSVTPSIRIPFICKMLLPESKLQDYADCKDYPVFEEAQVYNQVLVKSFDRFDFFKTLVSLGKNGGFIKPRSEVINGAKLMAQVLIHHPVADTFTTKLGVEKVKYTSAELESFSIEDLRNIGNWYEIAPMNSKSKYKSQIMEAQGNK